MFDTLFKNYEKGYNEGELEAKKNSFLEKLNSFLGNKTKVIKWVVKKLSMVFTDNLININVPKVNSIGFSGDPSLYDDYDENIVNKRFMNADIVLNKNEQIDDLLYTEDQDHNNDLLYRKGPSYDFYASAIAQENEKQRKIKKVVIVLGIIIFVAIILLVLGLSLKIDSNPLETSDANNNNENTKDRKSNLAPSKKDKIQDPDTSIILQVLPYAGVALGGIVPAIGLAVQNNSGSKNTALEKDNKDGVETIKDEPDGNTLVEGLDGTNRNEAKSKTDADIEPKEEAPSKSNEENDEK